MDFTFHPLPARLRDAKASGSRLFFTGKPCKRLHFCMRVSPSGLCIECKRLHAESLRATKTKREETNRKKREYWKRIQEESPEIYENAKETIRQYHKKIAEERNDVWDRRRVKRNAIRKTPEVKRKRTEDGIRRSKERIEEGDEQYIATLRWRQLIYRTLRYQGKGKDSKTVELLGYTAKQLREHIESLFEEGMSWSNHGEWHIDHKRPLSSFPPDTHPSIVNALDNLQPLWAIDNYRKHAKWDD